MAWKGPNVDDTAATHERNSFITYSSLYPSNWSQKKPKLILFAGTVLTKHPLWAHLFQPSPLKMVTGQAAVEWPASNALYFLYTLLNKPFLLNTRYKHTYNSHHPSKWSQGKQRAVEWPVPNGRSYSLVGCNCAISAIGKKERNCPEKAMKKDSAAEEKNSLCLLLLKFYAL